MIKKADKSDLFEIVALKIQLHKECDYYDVLRDDAESFILQTYQDLYDNHQAQHFVIKSQSKIVSCAGGFIKSEMPYTFRKTPFSGYITDVYTLPTHRKQGYAESLTNQVIAWLHDNNVKDIRLVSTAQSRQMYEKLGFRSTGEMILSVDDKYGAPHCARNGDGEKTELLKIVKARLEDMEAILQLQYTAYQSEALILGDFAIQPLTQTLDELIAEYHKSAVLKAVYRGEIIGSVRAYADGDTVYIGKLIVHPDHQGKGLGQRLLAAIEEEFPHKRYELFTSCKSDRNLHLYEKSGYVRFREKSNEAGIKFVYLEKTETIN